MQNRSIVLPSQLSHGIHQSQVSTTIGHLLYKSSIKYNGAGPITTRRIDQDPPAVVPCVLLSCSALTIFIPHLLHLRSAASCLDSLRPSFPPSISCSLQTSTFEGDGQNITHNGLFSGIQSVSLCRPKSKPRRLSIVKQEARLGHRKNVILEPPKWVFRLTPGRYERYLRCTVWVRLLTGTTEVVREKVQDGLTGETKEMQYTQCKIVGNGSFGVVFQTKLSPSGEDAAIKRVLQDKRFKVSPRSSFCFCSMS